MKGSPVRVRASAWRSGAIFWFTAIAFGVLAALPRKRIADGVLRGFAGSVAYFALSGGLGVALGTLTRNQVGAVAVVAVVIGVIDPAFAALVPEAGRFGPSALGIALSGGAADPEGPSRRCCRRDSRACVLRVRGDLRRRGGNARRAARRPRMT